MSDHESIFYEDGYFRIASQGAERYITTGDSALCIPMTDTGMVIFILEPAAAYHSALTMLLPGGIIEPGEKHEDAANREMQEEIGFKALRMDYLGALRPMPKYIRCTAHIYLARELTPSLLRGDEIHKIETQLVSLDHFERCITEGQLRDSTVIAALYLARQFVVNEKTGANR